MPPFALEDFDIRDATPSAAAITEAEAERIRRDAYETGFQAGATDAVSAFEADEARLSFELVTALRDLSFGFHEASTHVMSNVAPVLKAMIDTVLPQLMSETLGHTILEAVAPLVAEASDIPVRLLVSADEVSAIRQVVGASAEVPFVIVEDPGVVRGQAYLKLGAVERQIDVSGVLERISAAVDAVSELNMRKTTNA